MLQLKPAWSGSGFAARSEPEGAVVVTIFHFAEPVPDAFIAAFRETHQEGTTIATLVADPQPNSYPRLPVREGENVLVHIARFGDMPPNAAATLAPALRRQVARIETLRLLPTPQSRVRGNPQPAIA